MAQAKLARVDCSVARNLAGGGASAGDARVAGAVLLMAGLVIVLAAAAAFAQAGQVKAPTTRQQVGAGKTAAELRVTLLGTGNPRPSMDRFGPSILVEAGQQRILIDAGRGAAQRLFQLGQGTLLKSLDAVFLTHLHYDHTVGLPDVWLSGWLFGRAVPLPVYGPPGTAAMMASLERAFEIDIHSRREPKGRLPAAGVAVEPSDVQPGLIYEKDSLKVTAFAVDHRPATPAYGYRIDYRGRSAVFSGATRRSETLVEQARGVDVLVHEVVSPEVERRRAQVDPAAIEWIISQHTTAEDAGRIFARARPRLAVYSHIVPSPATSADLIPPTRKAYKGRLAVGHDLMMIAVGEQIRVATRRTLRDR